MREIEKYIDEYFEKRPQLTKPKKGVLGYEIPLPWDNLIHSMHNEIERLKEIEWMYNDLNK